MMGLIKEILPKRPDLKLVVMSATLDAGRFQVFLLISFHFRNISIMLLYILFQVVHIMWKSSIQINHKKTMFKLLKI